MQVRGLEAIKQFSDNLMQPYQPSREQKSSIVEELEAENARLRSENARLQSTVKELEGQQAGHQ